MSSFSIKRNYGKNFNKRHHVLSFNGVILSISNSGLYNNGNNFRYCKHYAFNALINYYYNTYQINTRIYEQLKKINNFEYLISDDNEIYKYVPPETINRINKFIDEQIIKMKIRDKIIENKDEVCPETSQL